MEPLITVILPCYNVEKYLRQCFASVAGQTYRNLEIILVDDGSPDSSGAICDELSRQDSRVKVIHKQNEGLGFARNSGLELATGKYVLFVDSDDYIHAEMVQKLYSRIEAYGADTSYCGYSVFYEDGKEIPKTSCYQDNIFENDAVINDILLEMVAGMPEAAVDAKVPMSVWHALYSMELIDQYHIRFPSEREYMSEDIIFHIAYLQHAVRVSYIGDALYYYRQVNHGSLTHIFKSNELERQKTMYEKISVDLSAFLNAERYELRAQRYFLGRVRTCIDKAVSFSEYNEQFDLMQYVKEVLKDQTVQRVISVYPYEKNPLKIRLFNSCIRYRFTSFVIILMKIRRSGGNTRF